MWEIWSDTVCLSWLYHFKLFKGCLQQIFLGPFSNNTHLIHFPSTSKDFMQFHCADIVIILFHNLFRKCEQLRRCLRICSNSLKIPFPPAITCSKATTEKPELYVKPGQLSTSVRRFWTQLFGRVQIKSSAKLEQLVNTIPVCWLYQ